MTNIMTVCYALNIKFCTMQQPIVKDTENTKVEVIFAKNVRPVPAAQTAKAIRKL
jgi:hypothetical protein